MRFRFRLLPAVSVWCVVLWCGVLDGLMLYLTDKLFLVSVGQTLSANPDTRKVYVSRVLVPADSLLLVDLRLSATDERASDSPLKQPPKNRRVSNGGGPGKTTRDCQPVASSHDVGSWELATLTCRVASSRSRVGVTYTLASLSSNSAYNLPSTISRLPQRSSKTTPTVFFPSFSFPLRHP
jgi:hypothetical protein